MTVVEVGFILVLSAFLKEIVQFILRILRKNHAPSAQKPLETSEAMDRYRNVMKESAETLAHSDASSVMKQFSEKFGKGKKG